MSGTMKLTPGRLPISQIETILGKALQDPAFAKSLQSDPAAALQSLGVTPHKDEIDFFKSIGAGGFASAAEALHKSDPGHYMCEM